MTEKKPASPHKITEMFAEGKRFTEEVMAENTRLRMVIAGQRNTIKDLEGDPDTELPWLQKRVSLLEKENHLLREELTEIKRQYNVIEKENWDFSERYLHVERQNTSLLNLYVASERLHSTLDFKNVLQVIQELVVNLIGSEVFEICLYDHHRGRLVSLAGVGTTAAAGTTVDITDTIKEAIASGTVQIMEPGSTGEALTACAPLRLADRVLGVILIRELLSQKEGFESIDHELFGLLGDRAAAVICASHLLNRAGGKENAELWSSLVDEMARAAEALDASELEPTVVW